MSVVTVADVEKARDVIVLQRGDVVTPLARDRAKELGVRLERSTDAGPNSKWSANADTSANGYANTKGNGDVKTRAGGKTNPSPGATANPSSSGGKPSASAAGTANHSNGSRNGSLTFPRPFPRDMPAERDVPAGSEPLRGLPPVASRASHNNGAHAAPRSGALYRRGARSGPASFARPTVAVVGAGHVGAATAIRLAESDLFERLTLIDVVDGLAAGLALDMWHSSGLLGFTTHVTGSSDIAAVAGADIVVITAGRPRQPGMTRTDLTAANAEIVRGIATIVREKAPGAVVVVVTNPLEEMTHLVAQVTGFPSQRVIGMGGMLDTARFRSLVGLTGVAKPEAVRALVLGSHGAEMVGPLSQATAAGTPLEELLDAKTLAEIISRTRESGAEVTGLLKAGSAFLSPGSAIARQVEAIARGSDEVLPACVEADGTYGIKGVRVGLPVRVGPEGVREIVELELRPAERRALQAAAEQIRARTRALAGP
jgi:malate dehydrogenase